jgi:alpha-beta hydrolase superfamily lysophospholipase
MRGPATAGHGVVVIIHGLHEAHLLKCTSASLP